MMTFVLEALRDRRSSRIVVARRGSSRSTTLEPM
jgi:hypothetical protein